MEDNNPRASNFIIRDGGIEELLKGLATGGYCSTGTGRIFRDENEITIEFCSNTGTYDGGVRALSFQIRIPLTEKEKLIEP